MDEPVNAQKSLGQHWLSDQASLNAMCEAADLQASDTVLEIGPGLGSLTALLVERVKNVVAVEFDKNLARQLPDRIKAQNLNVVQQDILKFDLTSLPSDYKIVANIPYYLTSNLIRVVSEAPSRPRTAALLVQKEVAERVAAQPGDMSLLSVTAQFYWQVRLGRVVPAELFMPAPKVDSQILILRRLDQTLFPGTDAKEFFHLVKAGFSQRRKTLLNSLSAGLHLSKEEVKSMCKKGAIDSGRRPQTLSLNEWHQLYKVFS